MATCPPLWIAVHLPLLQLEVFVTPLFAQQETQVSVILHQGRVTSMSASADQAGIRLNMRAGGVQMLCADADYYQRDHNKEKLALQAVATALLQYSPQVCLAEDDCILIDISASLSLFGGIRALRKRVQESMRLLGYTATTGIAPVARAAWLLAKQASRKLPRGQHVFKLQRLSQRLDKLPVKLLTAAEPLTELLQGIACYSLRDLRQLPRPGLQRRCGKALLMELDQAYGEQAEVHEWYLAAPEFKVKIELPDRIELAESLVIFARSLLAQLLGWLAAQQLAVTHIHMELLHERGRQAIPPTMFDLQLSQACWQESHLLSLFKEKLSQLKLHSAVIGMLLEVKQTILREAQSYTLFPEPGGQANEHKRLLELLVARLGEDNVLQPAPRADHRADIANHWISVIKKAPPPCPPSTLAGYALRPNWLLPQPLALDIHEHRPYYGSELKLVSPAERIEAGWWQEQIQTRDYYIAVDKRHVRYWIYRERANDPDSEEPVWFLHGIFG
ncbi:Y-family DNA polymerase [Undibacterium sp. TC9W]